MCVCVCVCVSKFLERPRHHSVCRIQIQLSSKCAQQITEWTSHHHPAQLRQLPVRPPPRPCPAHAPRWSGSGMCLSVLSVCLSVGLSVSRINGYARPCNCSRVCGLYVCVFCACISRGRMCKRRHALQVIEPIFIVYIAAYI